MNAADLPHFHAENGAEQFLIQGRPYLDRVSAADARNSGKLLDAGRAWISLLVPLSTGGGLSRAASRDQVMQTGDAALARLNKALAISPRDSAALTQIVGVYATESGVVAPVDPARAIQILNKGLDTFNRLAADARSSTAGLTQGAQLDIGLAWSRQRLGDYNQTLVTLARPREILERLAEIDPKNATNFRRIAAVCELSSAIHQWRREYLAGVEDLRKEIAVWDRLIAIDPSKPSNYMLRATCQGVVAKWLAGAGRMDEAAPYAQASIAYLTGVAEWPDATPPVLDEASIVLMVTPVLSLRDYPRALKYAQQADELSHRKDVALTYLAMAYANTGQAARALETVRRELALVPAPAPGQHASAARMNLEKEEHDIQTLIRTGKLPADFNT